MRSGLLLIGVLALLTGCSKSDDTPKVDPVAAKAQPGAETPPAATNTGVPMSQMRAEKSGG